jgi:hypothetical protein
MEQSCEDYSNENIIVLNHKIMELKESYINQLYL